MPDLPHPADKVPALLEGIPVKHQQKLINTSIPFNCTDVKGVDDTSDPFVK